MGGALRGTGATGTGRLGKGVTSWDKHSPGGGGRQAGLGVDRRGTPCAPTGGHALGPHARRGQQHGGPQRDSLSGAFVEEALVQQLQLLRVQIAREFQRELSVESQPVTPAPLQCRPVTQRGHAPPPQARAPT